MTFPASTAVGANSGPFTVTAVAHAVAVFAFLGSLASDTFSRSLAEVAVI